MQMTTRRSSPSKLAISSRTSHSAARFEVLLIIEAEASCASTSSNLLGYVSVALPVPCAA
eukprot:7383725-Prymnesium_polylepis.1